MTPDQLAIVYWVFGAGGPIAGLYWYLQRRKREPVDAATAQIANAVAISNVAKVVVDLLNEQIDDFKDDINKQNAKIEAQEIETRILKAKIFNIENIWASWYSDLSNKWAVHRLQEKAPSPPRMEL